MSDDVKTERAGMPPAARKSWETPMPKISSARETLARINRRIASEPNPKYRRWLEVNRDHWWGEVIGDLDMVMATLSRGPIRYTYDGHPFMRPDGPLPDSHDATREMYEAIKATGASIAGPFDEERMFVDDHGLMLGGILTTVLPGYFVTQHDEPINRDALYLMRFPNYTMARFDEDGLMMGEEIINGAPLLIKRVGPETIPLLLDGPLTV